MALFGLCLLTSARAEDSCPFLRNITTRPTLTGDWDAVRSDLARKGVTFDASMTQIGEGVVGGGKDGTWEYGARGNIAGNLDTDKLGLWPGGFLSLELEGNWSEAVNGRTGALMPVNSNQIYPVPASENFNVPQLAFAQFLSHYAGVIAGKLDTTSGDANEFAHGKGDTQFFNLAFNINPVTVVATPYSTLGTGVIVLPTADPNQALMNFLVLSATGKASTSGFDSLSSDNLTFASEGRVRTGFFGLTGHQLVGAEYSNRTFTSFDQTLRFQIERPGEDGLGDATPGGRLKIDLQKKSDTWAVYYNFDQFLYETDKAKGQGVGLFGRFGASDGNPNLMQYFFSAGVGGKGVVRGRPRDRFGLGYYYLNIESPTLRTERATRSFLRDEWGFEAFYNVAITPWMLLTPDIQVVGPAQKRQTPSNESVDLATVLGCRLQLIF
jgi:porin